MRVYFLHLIWHIMCVCVGRPVTLIFDLLTLKLVCNWCANWCLPLSHVILLEVVRGPSCSTCSLICRHVSKNKSNSYSHLNTFLYFYLIIFMSHQSYKPWMALNNIFFVLMPLRNYSLTHSLSPLRSWHTWMRYLSVPTNSEAHPDGMCWF